MQEDTCLAILTSVKTASKKLPILRGIVSKRDELHSELVNLKRAVIVQLGQFYFPIPLLDEIMTSFFNRESKD